MKLNRITAISLALLTTASAWAWGDSGHGAVMYIAYSHLNSSARVEVDRLVGLADDVRHRNLHMAAYWADEARNDQNGPWHYINHHFRTDGKPVTMKPLSENVVWAVNKFRREIKSQTLSHAKEAEAFRYLIHFVGDAHCPMHTIAKDSKEFPEGDRGGNDFPIRPGNGLPDWNTNLHRVWDSGCGAFALPMRRWETGAGYAIRNLAKKI